MNGPTQEPTMREEIADAIGAALPGTAPHLALAYIGRDRATLARDRILRGQPFLSALRTPTALRSVS